MQCNAMQCNAMQCNVWMHACRKTNNITIVVKKHLCRNVATQPRKTSRLMMMMMMMMMIMRCWIGSTWQMKLTMATIFVWLYCMVSCQIYQYVIICSYGLQLKNFIISIFSVYRLYTTHIYIYTSVCVLSYFVDFWHDSPKQSLPRSQQNQPARRIRESVCRGGPRDSYYFTK